MKQSTILFCCSVILSCGIISGCRPNNRPHDLPRLYPCVLKFILDDKPLDGAMVTLKSTDPAFSWMIGGITNENGVVEPHTHGRFPGVPEGEYRVTVAKGEDKQVGGKKIKDPESEEMIDSGGVLQVYTYVAEEMTDPEQTPFSVVVSKKAGKAEFDCGKSVNKLLKTYPL